VLELFFILSIINNQMPLLPTQSVVADLHCDALYMVLRGRKDLVTRSNSFEVDIPRLKQGGVNVQVFAIFVDPKTKGYYHYVMRAIDTLKAICQTDSADIELAKSPGDVRRIVRAGKIAAILAIEGGHALTETRSADTVHLSAGCLQRLREYYDAGVRMLTVTHNNTNEFADAALDSTSRPHNGLSPSGKELIKEANRLGMIIDVSHASEKTFRDIVEASTAPIIASHSNARAICDHPRNLTDEQIKAIAQNGGVVGINFHSSFLRSDKQRAAIEDIVSHIDHIIKLVGDDCLALGSDFDGMIKPPKDLKDVSQLPELTKALITRGYSEATIKKILGENFLRVFFTVAAMREKERS
jgi:membrane dipeptidase